MPGVEDEHSVEEFSREAANPAFHDRVCVGCPDPGSDDLDAFAGEDRVEHAGERGVLVVDQECDLCSMVAEVYEQVAGLLGDQVCGGMCGDAKDVYPAGGVFDDREAIQPGEEHGVAVKEVARENSVCLAAQELRPGGARASWGRVDSGALEDRLDRGGADLAAHAGEFCGDASVSPARVLGGEAQNHPAQRG